MSGIGTGGARRGAVELVAAGTLLGTLGVAVREAGLDSASAVFYRCVIGAMALGAWCLWAGGFAALPRLGRRTLALTLASGVLMAANWTLFFEAILRAGIAVATITFHVHPVLVLLLGAVVARERLERRQVVAVSLAFAGLALTVGTPQALAAMPAGWAAGVAAALTGAAAYAGVTLISRAVLGVPPALLAFLQCAVGIPLLAALGPAAPGGIGAAGWGWLLVIGVVHTGVVYVLTYDALRRLRTPTIAVLLFAYPASAVVVDHLVYGTPVGAAQIAGLTLVLAASLAALPQPRGAGRNAAA
jgi:drug/metabolite transporter (DMT)-like permease